MCQPAGSIHFSLVKAQRYKGPSECPYHATVVGINRSALNAANLVHADVYIGNYVKLKGEPSLVGTPPKYELVPIRAFPKPAHWKFLGF